MVVLAQEVSALCILPGEVTLCDEVPRSLSTNQCGGINPERESLAGQ